MRIPFTLRDVQRSLDQLENYAMECVTGGGIAPKKDPRWIALTEHVVYVHNQWARGRGLLHLSPERPDERTLSNWARRLKLNGTPHRRLAELLCHIDAIRAPHVWAETVDEPLEDYWFPYTGPHYIHIEPTTWEAAKGKDVRSGWHVKPVSAFLRANPADPDASFHLDPSNIDLLDELPGVLCTLWLKRNWQWAAHAELIRADMEPANTTVSELSDLTK